MRFALVLWLIFSLLFSGCHIFANPPAFMGAVRSVFPEAYTSALCHRARLLSYNGLEPKRICLALSADSPDDVRNLPQGLNVKVVNGMVTVCKEADGMSIGVVVEGLPDRSFYPIIKDIFRGMQQHTPEKPFDGRLEIWADRVQGYLWLKWRTGLDSVRLKDALMDVLGVLGISADYGDFKEDHGEMFYTGGSVYGYLIDIRAVDLDGDEFYNTVEFYVTYGKH